MTDINYLDLFSGIGGFSLGAYWSGFRCKNHFYSEIDAYCNKLYKVRFPDAIPLGDITKINTEELKQYGNEWIITGGFPCQDISIAGKGEGITGKRSGLWFEYWRIIRDLRPIFAIMENVPAITIRGLDRVLGSLSEIWYNAEWQTISAEEMGAPHKRERIWIIAYSNLQQRSSVLKKANIEKQFWRDDSRINILDDKKNQCLSIRNICGMDDGVSKSLDRFKGLGNSIVPQISQIIFERLKQIIE